MGGETGREQHIIDNRIWRKCCCVIGKPQGEGVSVAMRAQPQGEGVSVGAVEEPQGDGASVAMIGEPEGNAVSVGAVGEPQGYELNDKSGANYGLSVHLQKEA